MICFCVFGFDLLFQLELKPAQRVLRCSWGLFAFPAGIKTSAEGFEVLLGAICFSSAKGFEVLLVAICFSSGNSFC